MARRVAKLTQDELNSIEDRSHQDHHPIHCILLVLREIEREIHTYKIRH
jgi:hypothetical protein